MFNRLFGSEPLFTTALCANACPPQSAISTARLTISLFFIAATPSRRPRRVLFLYAIKTNHHRVFFLIFEKKAVYSAHSV